MRRFVFLWFFLFCGCLGAWAASDDPRQHIDRGRELFDRGHWSDARHELLAAQQALAPVDKAAAEAVSYTHLTLPTKRIV